MPIKEERSPASCAELTRATIKDIKSIYRNREKGKRKMEQGRKAARRSPVRDAILMGSFYGALLIAMVCIWAIDATGSFMPFLISMIALAYGGVFFGVNGHIINRRIERGWIKSARKRSD